ncbi:hypothetical protein JTE90_026000 [Oedothorax gibbosus]|uniref:Uncharacterized protein n=1 Tax=Oedothorax gibbosus TaxID=931172 RepID=A0AAV6UFR7_9ARAC|nr:hypothetical protein JTE90_026000 [Oedothorax gibbosus]
MQITQHNTLHFTGHNPSSEHKTKLKTTPFLEKKSLGATENNQTTQEQIAFSTLVCGHKTVKNASFEGKKIIYESKENVEEGRGRIFYYPSFRTFEEGVESCVEKQNEGLETHSIRSVRTQIR